MIDAHDHPKRRRLSGTVGSDESVDRPARHGKTEPVHGDMLSESFSDVLNFDDVHGSADSIADSVRFMEPPGGNYAIEADAVIADGNTRRRPAVQAQMPASKLRQASRANLWRRPARY